MKKSTETRMQDGNRDRNQMMENGMIEIRASNANIIIGFIWKFLERGITQITHLVLSLILARLLSPGDYGTLALITVFINISSILINNGFSVALVQKKDADRLDFSSVFFFTLFLAAIMYALLFASAPAIAAYYGNSGMEAVLRVLALQLFPGAASSVQNAYVSRTMQFKRLFLSSFLSMLISGITGIILAYCGAGIWALAVQSLLGTIMTSVVLFYAAGWRPEFEFSFQRIRSLLSFGSKMLGIGLLDSIFNNLYSIVIGRVFSTEQLGIYNRGQQMPQMIQSNIEGAVTGVALPAFSSDSENTGRVREMARKFMKGCTFIVFPSLFGLAAVAEPLTLALLTEKWKACIPYLRIFCFVYAVYSLNSIVVCSFYALGKSGLVFAMQAVKKILIAVLLAASVRHGAFAVAVSQLFQGIFECIIHAYFAKKILGYRYWHQLADVMPQFLASVMMYALVRLISMIQGMPVTAMLAFQILAGMVFYAGISRIFRIRALSMFLELAQKRRVQ